SEQRPRGDRRAAGDRACVDARGSRHGGTGQAGGRGRQRIEDVVAEALEEGRMTELPTLTRADSRWARVVGCGEASTWRRWWRRCSRVVVTSRPAPPGWHGES